VRRIATRNPLTNPELFQKMKPLNTLRLSALTLAVLLPFAAAAQSQPAPASDAVVSNAKAAALKSKNMADEARAALERAQAAAKAPMPKPHPLLAQPFNPQVGPRLIGTVEQMTATVAAVTAPAQAAPAMAKLQQLWPAYLQLDKEFSTQLEQIAAHEKAGKKSAEMKATEATMSASLEAKGMALDAELLRVSKLPLAPADMAMVQNLRKALAE
jgi:hypothetical protein